MQTMLKQTLTDQWTLRATSNDVPATIRDSVVPARVPGSVHTDLMRAGLIDDPYFGQNEPKLLWIGRTDWRYTTHFEADPKLFDQERIDLCCDGLDTIATIHLNGSAVANTQNMHRRYRFDVRKLLKKGMNELTIDFAAPVTWAEQMRDRLGFLPNVQYQAPYNFIRKMACNFGWDWGPQVATCGIWKAVRLEGWSGARIKHVRHTCLKSANVMALQFQVEREHAGSIANRTIDFGFDVYGPNGESIAVGGVSELDYTVEIPIEKPEFWWPRGHGNQPLYRLHIEAWNDKAAHQVVQAIGLRTIELDTSPDDIGAKMVLKVNGKPIFCKGYNWIPDDCFLERACEPTRVRKRIEQALDSNANMLRVWGGGIYETDEFYDICDETGMLVWQDFLFACAGYPEAEPFKTEVEAEARDNVARLAHHPSLVLWNGCNENVWMFRDNSGPDASGKIVPWKEQLDQKQWGQGYYFDLLPRVVKEVDPSRPYWAASPWSGDTNFKTGIHPNAQTHGNKHIWEVWHGKGDYSTYREFTPRFCSEFGYQGPANYSTLAEAFDPAELKPGSATMELHQKSPGGNARNERLLLKDFDVPADVDAWHYLLQINQARALKAGVEWFRSRQPVCMGTLYWQLNDCYPVVSWSAIDSAGRLKPLWYASRRFFAPRLLTIQPEGNELHAFINNDSDEPWRGLLTIRRLGFDGRECASARFEVDAPSRSNSKFTIPAEVAQPEDATQELIVAEMDRERGHWFFLPDRELKYPKRRLMRR